LQEWVDFDRWYRFDLLMMKTNQSTLPLEEIKV
jgi:hypothetical protein